MTERWCLEGRPLPQGIKPFGTTGALHMVVPPESSPSCPVCQKEFTERSNLQRHIRGSHQLLVGVGRESPRLVEVIPGFPTVKGEKVLCPECKVAFKDSRSAAEHWKERRCHRLREGHYGTRWMSGNNELAPADAAVATTTCTASSVTAEQQPLAGATAQLETTHKEQNQKPHMKQQTRADEPQARDIPEWEIQRDAILASMADKWCIESTAREVMKMVARAKMLLRKDWEAIPQESPAHAWRHLTGITPRRFRVPAAPCLDTSQKKPGKGHAMPPGRHKGRWRVATLNVQGKAQPEDLVACCRSHNIDIMAATETHVRKTADFRLQGYRCIFTQCARGDAGVGFVIRDHIGASDRLNPRHSISPPVLRTHFYGSRCGLLETKQNGIRISIVVGYAPTNPKTVEERTSFWEDVNQALGQAKGRIMLAGDFNAQIPNRVLQDPLNENGEALQNVALQHSLCFRSLQFRKPKAKLWTWVGHLESLKRPRVLDYILYQENHDRDVEDCNVRTPALVTDHRMVIAELKAKWTPGRTRTTGKAQHEEIQSQQTTTKGHAGPSSETEERFTELQKQYLAIPTEFKGKPAKTAEWLDTKTLEAISLKGRAFVRWRLQPSPSTCAEYKSARNWASKLRTAAWNRYWSEWATKIEQAFTGGKTGEGFALLAKAYRPSQCRLKTDETDLTECQKYFQSVLQEEPKRPQATEQLAKIRLAQETPPNSELPTTPMSTLPQEWTGVPDDVPSDDEILAALAEMRSGAPGKDGMRVEVIKKSKPLTAATCALVKTAWRTGKVPIAWQEAVLVAIPKKGGSQAVTDMRGITLLSVTGKIVSRLIHNRTKSIPLLPEQHGFRSNDGTIAPILSTKLIMQQATRCGVPMVSIFLDIKKAYDWIPREILLETLAQYGFREKVLGLVRALYEDRIFVKVGGDMSEEPFQSRNGVRQGCPLSPTLFNVVMDRVLRTALPKMRGVTLEDSGGRWEAKIHAYADDIVVFAPTMEAAQRDVSVLVQALAAAGMTVSTSKTKYIQQPDKRRPPPTPPLALPDEISSVEGHLYMTMPAATRKIPCPVCKTVLENRTTLQKHLRTGHALAVTVGQNPPRKVEDMPTFVTGEDGRISCPECKTSLKNVRAASEHWGKRRCHQKPFGFHGTHIVSGNTPLEAVDDNTPQHDTTPSEPPRRLEVYGEPLEKVESFTYLGRVLSQSDDDSPAIQARINAAATAFWSLQRRFFAKKHIHQGTKLAVVRAILMAKIVYGAETWLIKEQDAEKLRALQQKLLRHATRMHPMMTPEGLRYPSREAVLKKSGQDDIVAQVESSQLRFIGHIFRHPLHEQLQRLLHSSMTEQGRQGYTDTNLLSHRIELKMKAVELSQSDAQNREKWKRAVLQVASGQKPRLRGTGSRTGL